MTPGDEGGGEADRSGLHMAPSLGEPCRKPAAGCAVTPRRGGQAPAAPRPPERDQAPQAARRQPPGRQRRWLPADRPAAARPGDQGRPITWVTTSQAAERAEQAADDGRGHADHQILDQEGPHQHLAPGARAPSARRPRSDGAGGRRAMPPASTRMPPTRVSPATMSTASSTRPSTSVARATTSRIAIGVTLGSRVGERVQQTAPRRRPGRRPRPRRYAGRSARTRRADDEQEVEPAAAPVDLAADVGDLGLDGPAEHVEGQRVADADAVALGNLVVDRDQRRPLVIGRPPAALRPARCPRAGSPRR